jgi:hypothetical protein
MPGGKGRITFADAKPFVKGDPRINRLGTPRKLNLDKLLRKGVMTRVNNQSALKGILMKLRDMALDGDIRAAELLLDRAFGRAKQTAETTRPLMITAIQYILPDGNKDQANAEAARSVGIIEEQ